MNRHSFTAGLRVICLLSGCLFYFAAQAQSTEATQMTVHAVAYFDVAHNKHGDAVAALKQYRDTSREETGFVAMQTLEQIERADHFVVLETWRDQTAWERHSAAAASTRLQAALQGIRLGTLDLRIYKPLAVSADSSDKAALFVVRHVDIGGPQRDAPQLLMQWAEESRKDAGNLRFDVLQQSTRGNHFTVVEAWRDQAAWNAHAAATHTRRSREQLEPSTGSPVDERLYKMLD